ncbi:cation diffusion facilitator family transporter [Sinirhodobacter sp. WL0062]|uniref:Cation diffusion facilitator family transporter n=1 Tax=Rhodobacter flavimaris TaxID=2907145 RepID=A0ABS8YWH6_9RHOB|nr:cation diffusion facilitator family transporter [Sinirhodobacter sp. WL0062]MCE5973868.1 cation diffusion facilitator family transporter [Sinirhodobacter sp. WL0062]
MSYNDAQTRLNLSAGLASVAVAAVLVGMKLWALWATGALSIAASLADSAMDLLISGAGLGAIIYAARPADDDHAFGHTSVEDLASLGQALFVSVSAIAIAVAAGGRLLSQTPQALAAEGAGILVMALSATLTLGLVAWQARVARKTGNKVVAADMLHYVGDLLPTIGAILALWLSSRFGWSKVDSIVALIAAAIMLRGAGQIGVSAWHALMDRAAPQEIIDGIAEIAQIWPGVMGFHDLKTRTAGAKIFVQLHIELDGAQSLDAAHEIAASLKRAIIEAYPQAEVIIHKDVWRG